ncbi:xanthine dehydrogenase family protein [Candidatus Sumerlaeota bacterium]|nr:xanthine dehydrogenase family protein [Candidatus Sumerlaeota bacterium]
MKELDIVGKSIDRPDARAKVSGRALYCDDLPSVSGLLYAGIIKSPVPAGRIKGIHIEDALSVDGVVDIVLAHHIPGKNLVPLIFDDWIVLADKEVRYAGEPIGVVVAEHPRALDIALNKVKVDIEPLPALLSPFDAMKPDARKINPRGNIFNHHKIRRGDVESGFAEADIVVEGEYQTGYQEHAYLEPLSLMAKPTPDQGMQVWGGMQCPFYVQSAVATVLGIALNKVEVIQTTTGGAFGGKEDVPSRFAGIVALAAWRSGRAVRLTFSREEDIVSTSKRHPSFSRYRIGARRDGRLVACTAEVIMDAGAYATLSPSVSWRATVHCCGPYRIPNVRVDVYAVATNKVPAGAFRGFGTPQVIFAMERVMDELANQLKMDPLELRRRNILRRGDTTVTGQRLPWSVGLGRTLQECAKKSNWKKRRKAAEQSTGTKKRGIGCATFLYGVGLGAAGRKIDRAEASVQVEGDGSVRFSVGTTEMGQGMESVLTQIVAEALGGISPGLVTMTEVSTSRVQDSGPTVASRATYMSGNALRIACSQILNRMRAVAGERLHIPASRVVVTGGRFKAGTEEIDFREIACECFERHVPLSARALYDSPPTSWDAETGQGKAYVVYSYATHIAEVEVDTETGIVSVLRFWAAHDVGKAVNPQLVEGQIEGGVVQGIGYALMESLLTANDGHILNPDFETYIIPTSKDIPEIYPIIVESPYPEGPFGAKGFGETPLMGCGAAIANAVSNAIGRPITRLPILPEDILALFKICSAPNR